jgi:hypothetical protein
MSSEYDNKSTAKIASFIIIICCYVPQMEYEKSHHVPITISITTTTSFLAEQPIQTGFKFTPPCTHNNLNTYEKMTPG